MKKQAKFEIRITQLGRRWYIRQMNHPLGPSNCVRADIVGAFKHAHPAAFYSGDIEVRKIVTVVNAHCKKYYEDEDEEYGRHPIMRCFEKGYLYIKVL